MRCAVNTATVSAIVRPLTPFVAASLLVANFAVSGFAHAVPQTNAPDSGSNAVSTASQDDLLPWEREAADRAAAVPQASPLSVPAKGGEKERAVPDAHRVPPHPVVIVLREMLAGDIFAKNDFVKSAPKADIAALRSFYEASNAAPVWVDEKGISPKGKAVLAEIARANDWGLEVEDFSLPDGEALMPTDETSHAIAEARIDLAVLKYARLAQGGRDTPSEISALFDQTVELPQPAMVMEAVRAAPTPDAYLQSLHPSHAQFVRLRDALAVARAAEKPNERDIKRIILNMERWRWMPRDLGAFHVWLNTPAFMLYVVKDGKTLYTDKTLVGTRKYSTPVFSAALETIVFNPNWIAPPSVLRDKLWPALKRKDFTVITSNKLRVSYKGRRIDPTRVDWQRSNIHNFVFTQKAGPTNVLGKAKFLYPNEHFVYMHDTLPSKRKNFKKTMRAYGNGCVRMENPQDFAALMLEADQQFPKSEVGALWKKGINKSVTLKTMPPVHTTYFTMVVDEEGKVTTFNDLYGLDRKHAKALFGTEEGFVPVRKKRKRKSGSVASARSNGLSNGFGLFGN